MQHSTVRSPSWAFGGRKYIEARTKSCWRRLFCIVSLLDLSFARGGLWRFVKTGDRGVTEIAPAGRATVLRFCTVAGRPFDSHWPFEKDLTTERPKGGEALGMKKKWCTP